MNIDASKECAEELRDRLSIQTLLKQGYKIQDKNGNIIETLPNIKVDYTSFPRDGECLKKGMYDFWKINKKVAEELVGKSLGDDEYMYECCRYISCLTDCMDCMDIYDDGVLCGGDRYFLSKESIKEAIECMTNILNIYDEHFENFMHHQLDKFVNNCMILAKKHEGQLKRTKKYIKKNPVIGENEDGIIYVMKNCGYYKIGKAKIGSTRFGEYTKLPEEPEYIIKQTVSNYGKVEIALHERYREKRLRDGNCEWFDLTDKDLDEIKEFIYKYSV